MRKVRLCRKSEYYCDREVRFARWERRLWRREARRQEKWAAAFAVTAFLLGSAVCIVLSLYMG